MVSARGRDVGPAMAGRARHRAGAGHAPGSCGVGALGRATRRGGPVDARAGRGGALASRRSFARALRVPNSRSFALRALPTAGPSLRALRALPTAGPSLRALRALRSG